MKTLLITVLAIVMASHLVTSAYAQVSSGDSPFERKFGDIKFLDAYFGRVNEKIEASPGDRNVPFTIVFANVGSQDITGIRGQLQMPIGFSSADGKGAVMVADTETESLAGEYFSLTFFVNIDKYAPIQQYPATVKVDYVRIREAGQRQHFSDFTFRVTGESILNLKAVDPFLTSLKNNEVIVEISNTGDAPISNAKVTLQNTEARTDRETTLTNIENVVFDQSRWNLGTINPASKKYLTLKIYVPENVHSTTLHTIMEIVYNNAHGDEVNTKRTVDYFINGFIDARIYNIDVINLAGRQTVIGEVINEGNTNALFSFVTLEPLGDSNIRPKTQFIDELETDSPVPFNIPIEFDGDPKYGDHNIKVTVRYKDNMREEHLITEEAVITLVDTTIKPETTPMDYAPAIVVLVIASVAGIMVYKRLKRKKEESAEADSSE